MLPHVILRRGNSHRVLLIHLSQSALQAIILVKLETSLSHTSLENPKTRPIVSSLPSKMLENLKVILQSRNCTKIA